MTGNQRSERVFSPCCQPSPIQMLRCVYYCCIPTTKLIVWQFMLMSWYHSLTRECQSCRETSGEWEKSGETFSFYS